MPRSAQIGLILVAFASSLVAGVPHGELGEPQSVSVSVNWSAPLRTVVTSAQIEVDVMPFLARTTQGGVVPVAFCSSSLRGRLGAGDFNGYVTALANLGAEYVRYSPWFGQHRQP